MIHDGCCNIASLLPRRAAERPHQLAVACPVGRDAAGRVSYSHYTFAQLDRESDLLARGLRASGIGAGCRTVLMVTPSLDFFALTFALFKAGAIPVLIDPGMGVWKLRRCMKEARPSAFIGVQKAHLARILFGWGRGRRQTLITVGRKSRLCGGIDLAALRLLGRQSVEQPFFEGDIDDLAAILFTSGSTGSPKGAIYSHRMFLTQVRLLQETYGIEAGETDLSTFPLFALFGPALGMTAVIPDMDPTRPAQVNPERIAEAIDDFGISNMFGSPALIRRVGRWGVEQRHPFPTLRRVISAGAPVPAPVLAQMAQLLADGVQVHTPYGATEALPVATIGSDEVLAETRFRTDMGKGICVGRPLAGIELAVIGIDDLPIKHWTDSLKVPTGQIGEICVCGPQVSRAYDHRADANRLGKIADTNDRIWHRMGDLGYLDDDGRLWFCGRKAHRVIGAGQVWFTIPVEAVFNTHPDVYRTALVGLGKPGRQTPALCVELEAGVAADQWLRIHDELVRLAARFDHTRDIHQLLHHPGFPVDIRHNAKIFREQLAPWARKQVKRS